MLLILWQDSKVPMALDWQDPSKTESLLINADRPVWLVVRGPRNEGTRHDIMNDGLYSTNQTMALFWLYKELIVVVNSNSSKSMNNSLACTDQQNIVSTKSQCTCPPSTIMLNTT